MFQLKAKNNKFIVLPVDDDDDDGSSSDDDAIASTTIARFCSHFTNYVGRWEHFCVSIKIVMELCVPVIVWSHWTKKTELAERPSGGERVSERGSDTEHVNWSVASNKRERKAMNSTSEWVLFFFFFLFFIRKRRAINFMLFSCFCYAIAFARIFCPTPSALGKAIEHLNFSVFL